MTFVSLELHSNIVATVLLCGKCVFMKVIKFETLVNL